MPEDVSVYEAAIKTVGQPEGFRARRRAVAVWRAVFSSPGPHTLHGTSMASGIDAVSASELPDPASPPRDPGLRRLVPLVVVVAVVDTTFFAAITPLLPHYASELNLSTSAAGVLSAAYAAGFVICALPGGWIAARIGVRRALLLGLTLLSASSVAFAFAQDLALLDLARFLQGMGGAFSWAAGLTWVATVAPRRRRGEMVGTVIAAAVAGTVLGPALGGFASAVGPELIFSAVGGVSVGLAMWTLVVRAHTPPRRQPDIGVVIRSFRRPPILFGLWLTALPSLFAGVLAVLAPLRFDELGASGLAIGAVFLLAAGAESGATLTLGRLSDRRGRLAPIRMGLWILAVAAVALALLPSLLVVAAFVIVAVVGFGFIWAPASVLLSEMGEKQGMELSLAFALFNFAWALGQVLGGAGGAGIADLTSDSVPYLLAFILCLVTLAGIGSVDTATQS